MVTESPDDKENIRLLEEKLVVNRTKRKVGEVVVRKTVETEMVQVPVRREKLIVEQVEPETKRLAEIDLGTGEVKESAGIDTPNFSRAHTISGEFSSPEAASDFLEAIARHQPHGCQKVRVELIVENAELRERYREMLDRRP
jgi:hypothetical protein